MLAPTPQDSYLRTKCGLPPRVTVTPDPDDPATRELTTAEAADAAHVSTDTIRDWARPSRGLLHSVAEPGEAPRYLEIEVLAAEARTRREARRRALAAEAAADLDARG